jgi:hypothetical protein
MRRRTLRTRTNHQSTDSRTRTNTFLIPCMLQGPSHSPTIQKQLKHTYIYWYDIQWRSSRLQITINNRTVFVPAVPVPISEPLCAAPIRVNKETNTHPDGSQTIITETFFLMGRVRGRKNALLLHSDIGNLRFTRTNLLRYLFTVHQQDHIRLRFRMHKIQHLGSDSFLLFCYLLRFVLLA